MRVECKISKRDARNYQITVGKTYLAVEVNIHPFAEDTSQRLLFRLSADDDDVPGLYEADLFVLVDERMPSQWVLTYSSRGRSCVIGPKAWSAPGFWEDYFDGAALAQHAFNDELQRMNEELG
jgi:hypothetical protein